MQENKIASVREVLEAMTTEQLDALLNRELHAETPDMDAIRLILDILWEREKDMPVEMTPRMQEAWNQYRRDMGRTSQKTPKAGQIRKLFLRVVSSAAVLVLAVMLLVPQKANAGSLWDWLVRITDNVMEFFTPEDTPSRIMEYEFKTENPGLQKIHDLAVAEGVDFPSVPMWLSGNFELSESGVYNTPAKKSIYANFVNDTQDCVINIDVYSHDVAHSFDKDETNITVIEIQGTQFTILCNNDMWTAVWGQDNIECSIAIDCREEELYRILKSIYVMEE